MDTDDVAACVSTITNYIVNHARLQPNDSNRFFNRQLRTQIIERSGFSCENILDDGERCGTTLSTIISMRTTLYLTAKVAQPLSKMGRPFLCSWWRRGSVELAGEHCDDRTHARSLI
jgi:hypothetical protein